eukprot:1160015-Pelagomonas_calceolata.AAC.6
MVTMEDDLQAGCLADQLVAGTEKQLENSLDAAKKVVSQRNSQNSRRPGSKDQKARDTCSTKDTLVHRYN